MVRLAAGLKLTDPGASGLPTSIDRNRLEDALVNGFKPYGGGRPHALEPALRQRIIFPAYRAGQLAVDELNIVADCIGSIYIEPRSMEIFLRGKILKFAIARE